MHHTSRITLLIINILTITTLIPEKNPVIIGLVATRNGALIIEACLRAMAEYTDKIIVLDDASEDNTVEVIQKLSEELNITKIITKKEWIRDERADKWALLQAGRQAGGTHFILLDDDEILSANCAENQWLYNQIINMKPGQIMTFPMVNLWDSINLYRDDQLCTPKSWKWGSITAVFCDDGVCNYNDNIAWGPSGSMHISRAPANRKKGDYPDTIKRHDLTYVLLHFKSIFLEDIRIKKAWYMMLECIRMKKEGTLTPKSIKKINDFYHKEFASMLPKESDIQLSTVPAYWINYTWLNESQYRQPNIWRQKDIIGWFNTYGFDYFKDIDIWDIAWINEQKEHYQKTT